MQNKQNPWRVEIKETPPNEMERYLLYSDYITNQKRGFIETIKIVDKLITDLQDNGELTEYVKINARIKSTESALKNDDKKNKALNDAFGMEIIAGTESALKRIMDKLEEYMRVRKENPINKDNGYVAMHKIMDLEKEAYTKLATGNVPYNEVPLIEIQFKTFEVKENATSGPANHWEYKGETREQIQAMYDRNGFNEHNLPIMYAVENHKIRILSKQETIRKLYPFLRLSRDKGVEK